MSAYLFLPRCRLSILQESAAADLPLPLCGLMSDGIFLVILRTLPHPAGPTAASLVQTSVPQNFSVRCSPLWQTSNWPSGLLSHTSFTQPTDWRCRNSPSATARNQTAHLKMAHFTFFEFHFNFKKLITEQVVTSSFFLHWLMN